MSNNTLRVWSREDTSKTRILTSTKSSPWFTMTLLDEFDPSTMPIFGSIVFVRLKYFANFILVRFLRDVGELHTCREPRTIWNVK